MTTRRLASIIRKCLLAAVLISPSAAAIYVATSPETPHGGITRNAAVSAARTLADPGAVATTSAVVQHDVTGGIPGGKDIHQWVWLVTFAGQWHLLCSGVPDGCNPTTEWVAVDYYTGTWVRSEYEYPAG